MLDFTVPKMPPALAKWMADYKPDPDMRQWMKFGSPIGFGDTMRVVGYEWAIPLSTKEAMAKRFVMDSYIRLGRELPSLGSPSFKTLKALQPNFDFAYDANDLTFDPKLAGKWRIAAQEITIDHLVWAAKIGYMPAMDAAAAIFMAYYNNAKWPYLRTGGNEGQPYMNRGRCRTARGCLALCRGMLEILEDVLNIQEGPQHEFLTKLLDEHMTRIGDHWPLVDDAAGDHLPVPFMSFYQTATLWIELREVGEKLRLQSSYDATYKVGAYIRDMLPILKAKEDGSSWYYDVAIVDGKPTFHPDMPKQQGGIGGTNAWCARLIGTYDRDSWDTLIAQARAIKWPETRPDLMAQFFGVVV